MASEPQYPEYVILETDEYTVTPSGRHIHGPGTVVQCFDDASTVRCFGGARAVDTDRPAVLAPWKDRARPMGDVVLRRVATGGPEARKAAEQGIPDMVSFVGRLFGMADTYRDGAKRWQSWRLYLSEDFRLVLQTVGETTVPGEFSLYDVKVYDTAEALVEALGSTYLARRLYADAAPIGLARLTAASLDDL